jgi:hypothetical protein
MKRYAIKGATGYRSILELVDEAEDGFSVRITRIYDDYQDVREDFLPKNLLETCVRTGYLIEQIA